MPAAASHGTATPATPHLGHPAVPTVIVNNGPSQHQNIANGGTGTQNGQQEPAPGDADALELSDAQQVAHPHTEVTATVGLAINVKKFTSDSEIKNSKLFF